MPYTYLITGASRGIGLEFARVLSARGERVLAAVRDPRGSAALAPLAPRVHAVELDVSDVRSIETLGERVGDGPIDVLINNAGVTSRATKSIASLDAADMQAVFMVNSIAPMLVTKSLLPNLRAGARKLIIQITSQLGSIANNTGGSSYGYRASKTALNQLNRSLSNDLRPEGFTCVAIHPGWVRTDMGGPDADLTVAQSVASMVRVIDGLAAARSGAFLNYDGGELPW
jgi:NAD(P)-dependent dehydrogenase (short-subunit alcohol dehydrogenase family)